MKQTWSGLALFFSAAFITVACSSTGGGGGAAACDDAGLCPSGLVCDKGYCVTPGGSGGGGAGGGTGGGTTGGIGGMGGMGGGMGGGTTGGFGGGVGATGGMGAMGGSGATGGFGGGSGGSGGGSGGGGSCQSTIQGKKCADVLKTTTTCGACAQSYCCSTVNTCLADATCAGLFQCALGTCASAPDLENCIGQSCPSCATVPAQTAFAAIDTCLTNNCSTECQ